MSRKPENTFIDKVNDKLPIAKRKRSAKAREAHPGVQLHYEKNNNPFRGGTADSWYSALPKDLWVEYKYIPRVPQRGVIKPLELLSSLQCEWLNGRLGEGRNVAVIIGCPIGGVVLTERAWEKELPVQEFLSLVRSVPDLAAWIAQNTFKTTR